MSTFVGPAPVAIPMSGFNDRSLGLEKALVYDNTAGHYILMSAQVAQAEVAIAKRSAWKTWSILAAVVLVLCTVSALLGFLASRGGDSARNALTRLTGNASEATITPYAPVQASLPTAATSSVAALPPVVAASASVALAPTTAPSATLTLPQGAAASQPVLAAVLAPAVAPASTRVVTANPVQGPAPIQAPVVAPVPVASTPAVVKVARAPGFTASAPIVMEPVVKSAPTPPPVVAKPVAKSATPVSKVASVQAKPPAPAEPRVPPVADSAPVKPPPLRVGVQHVSSQGVYYFDGATNKLFGVGATLPNGEKIIDVDETSSTYATDKGVRQIRLPKP